MVDRQFETLPVTIRQEFWLSLSSSLPDWPHGVKHQPGLQIARGRCNRIPGGTTVRIAARRFLEERRPAAR